MSRHPQYMLLLYTLHEHILHTVFYLNQMRVMKYAVFDYVDYHHLRFHRRSPLRSAYCITANDWESPRKVCCRCTPEPG